jgi:hypothetical protein
MSSEKILNALVSDVLDFQQVKAGIFRKYNTLFDLKKAV